MNNQNEEPSIAPEPNRWYNITLGPSLLSDGHPYNSPRFCTLRYEFKPASIDKTKPGSFHKSHDNRVTLEFQNSQIDSAAPSIITEATKVVPSVANTVKPVKVTEIDINNPLSLDHENEEDHNRIVCELEEDVNNDDDDDGGGQESARKETTKEFRTGGLDIDINLPHPSEMEEDEIADVVINDDESFEGLNAAEALRAQVNAEAREQQQKSSSSSSGRDSESSESRAESSGSGSRSSSSSSD